MVMMIEEGLLGVHLLQVAVGFGMHFDAVGRGRDSRARTVEVLLQLGLRLGKQGRTGLRDGCRAIVGEAMCGLLKAGALVLGVGRGKLGVQVEVERVLGVGVAEVGEIVQVEIDEVGKVVAGFDVHSERVSTTRPGLWRTVHGTVVIVCIIVDL